MNNSVINFIKSSLKEINPWHNIRTLHTNIWGDIIAGITVAIIALPLALAFGEMSKLGALAGVWGAIAGGIVGGLFGGCMVGVSGPTGPKAAQIGAFMGAFVLAETNDPDLVAAFSIIFLSGVILVIISLLKISQFIHYIPYSVVAGFMCGIGVLVITTQLNAFMGVDEDKSFLYALKNFNINALYVSVPSLLILFLWSYVKNFNQIFSKVPAPLLALSVGSFIAYVMNLDITYIVVDTEGDILDYKEPDLTRLKEFIGPAFALAGLAILDSLLSCVVADNMTRKRHSSDRETFGQGMANIAAGLVGGVTTATATMRTVANIKFGAKTPLASIVHGYTLLVILLGLGFLVESIPTACLAAILFKVGIEIMDYRILPVLRKLPFIDLLVFSIVLFVTVYADLMIAVFIGVVLIIVKSFKEIMLTFQAKYTHKFNDLLSSDFSFSDSKKQKLSKIPISVLKPDGPLFFGSFEILMKKYDSDSGHKVLIIDLKDVTKVDLSGVYALEDFIHNEESKDIKVYVVNINSKIDKMLNRLDFTKNIGSNCYQKSTSSLFDTILKET